MTEPAAAQRLAWQNGTITRIARRSPTVSSVFLDLAKPFSYVAGQHVEVRLTAPDGYQARRSYSIASAPDSPEGIELAIERLVDGEVSPFFHEVARIGDEIELRGPIGGHFIWRPGESGPVLLICGGSGVVPLMSMARHRAAVGSQAPMALLFSARTQPDILFRDELETMRDRADGFHLAVTLTRETPRDPGYFARRIDGSMIATVLAALPAAPKAVFICGSNAFVAAAADGVIDAGIAASLVKTERYGV